VAGDTFAIKGGTRYPHVLVATHSGASGNPITTDCDSGWGAGRAILDASDVCTIRPAEDIDDAGGAANWEQLHIIEHPAIQQGEIISFQDDVSGMMMPGRFPEHPAATLFTNGKLFSTWVYPGWALEFDADAMPRNPDDTRFLDPARINNGYIVSAPMAARAAGQEGWCKFVFHDRGVQVTRGEILSVSGDDIYLDIDDKRKFGPTSTNGGWGPYADPRGFLDRDRHSVTSPGYFAPIAEGKAVAYLRPGVAAVRINQTRIIWDFNGRSHVVLKGPTITGSQMQDPVSMSGSVSCSFTDFVARDCYGEAGGKGFSGSGRFVSMSDSTDCTVARGTMTRGVDVGGFTMNGSTGALVENISLSFFGRTGIGSSGGTTDMLIRQVILSDCHGVHANGFSHYANSSSESGGAKWQDVFCYNSTRPFTIQRNSTPPVTDTTFENANLFCILIGDEEGGGIEAGIHWNGGQNFDGVTMTGGVFVGPDGGIVAGRTIQNLTITGVRANSIANSAGSGTDNRGTTHSISDNQIDAMTAILADSVLTPFYCSTIGKDDVPFALDLTDNPQDDLPGVS
jgi:hypothetical protein